LSKIHFVKTSATTLKA